MRRITEEDLEDMLKMLNKSMGYKGISWNEKQRKYTGKGFIIQGAYGGQQLQFVNYAKSNGVRSVYGGYVPKRELYDTMYHMIRGIEWYQRRTKY